MKDIIPAKKQSPILGLSGMGGGVGSNIVAGLAAGPAYVDDVFSTYLYKGTGTDQSFNNGIKIGNSNAGSGVGFNGAGDYLTIGPSSDFSFGTGDFTIEFWVKKPDSTQGGFFQISSVAGGLSSSSLGNTIAAAWNGGAWQMYGGGVDSTGSGSITSNAWYHIAVVKSSNTLKMYVNGTSVMSRSDTNNYSHTYLGINGYYSSTYTNKGTLSNFRVVKGTAVYTGNFTPPTAELTSIANTKLLCCNTSITIAATVTPGPIGVPEGDPYPSGGPFTATDGEGGMVWMKDRDSGMNYVLMDTERGIDKILHTDGTWSDTAAAANDQANTFRSFDNNGFTIGNTGYVNTSGNDYTSWTWRKQKGFFDIVKYTGTGSATTIPHNLGSVPGMIIIKRYGAPEGWRVYHRGTSSTPAASGLYLNTNDPLTSNSTYFNNTLPTSSVFSVGTDDTVNLLNNGYIAYLFAGGESTASNARSVDFNGSSDRIITNASSSDFTMGTGDFTVECWVKGNSYNKGIFQISDNSNGLKGSGYQYDISLWTHSDGRLGTSIGGSNVYGSGKLGKGQWHHVAITRSSGTEYIFLDGTLQFSGSESQNYDGTYIAIGGYYDTSYLWNGQISNLRVVKGTALYTSSFKPSTEPLTNVTNTKLLCCQGATVLADTVKPSGTALQDYNNRTSASNTDSPFDDPDGFKFGEDSDENIIKCGSYTGNGDATNGTRVYLGFEPQWLLIKSTGFTEHWHCFDCMRGMVNGGNDMRLEVNYATTEYTGADFIDIHPDGFTALFNPNVNKNNENFVYIAVRRPDGYVGKLPEAGTDVFAQGTGNSLSTIPNFNSGFPVDFALVKKPATVQDWYTGARLTAKKFMYTNGTSAEGDSSEYVFDSNAGWMKGTANDSSYQSWMWKRHAGFDVVAYDGNGTVGNQILHSLGKVPQMIWTKKRSGTEDWVVYNEFLNGGTNPANYYLSLNLTHEQSESSIYWNNTVPTSTHFTVGGSNRVNNSSGEYISMLFASVEGVSKVGSYVGNSGTISITTGFRPRFLIIKNTTWTYGGWVVFDTLRALGASNDYLLYLNSTQAQQTNQDFGDISSTGFSMGSGDFAVNANNHNFIYYAHA